MNIKSLLIICFTILLNTGRVFSQVSIIKPISISWMADNSEVSLKQGFEVGIPQPEKLILKVVFPNDIDPKKAKEDLKWEFVWYYYYATTKSFMDSYTVSYSNLKEGDILSEDKKNLILKSTRGDIYSGWWEVEVISKSEDKPLSFNGVTKFQIYIN